MGAGHGNDSQQGWVAKAACGRSLEAQIADIKTYGNHGATPMLRAMILGASGIARTRDRAENVLLFGCYRPFSTPYLVRDAVRLLDLLGVPYTWLDKEYCCGLPLLHQIEPGGREGVLAAVREFLNANRELVRERDGDRLVYCCAGCAHTARAALPEAQAEHVYFLDVLLDKLESRPLGMAPLSVAFFEGCHTSYRLPFPDTSLDWGRYRRFLDTIDGLTVTDVSNKTCCKTQADKIIETAMGRGADALVCACSGCNVALRAAGRGKLPVLSYPELLLRCVEGG
jgi:Fe-S oxidoreductase